MTTIGEEIAKLEKIELERENSIYKRLTPYLSVKASYSTTKQDALEIFYIWIIEKGVLRTFDSSVDLDEHIEECIDSFYKQFIVNNKAGEKLLLSRDTLKYYYECVSNLNLEVFKILEEHEFLTKDDNLGNRFNPIKTKKFNDLPTEEQLHIEKESKKKKEELIRKFLEAKNKEP